MVYQGHDLYNISCLPLSPYGYLGAVTYCCWCALQQDIVSYFTSHEINKKFKI